MNRFGRVLAPLILICGPGNAGAFDTVALELGTGDDSATRVGVRLDRTWQRKWFADGDWYLGGYWELSASYWDAGAGRTGNDSLGDFGLAPVLRLQPHRDRAGFLPFLELGIGAHVFTDDELEDKDFDINFSFGSHLGAGVRFGDAGRWELGYRYQHLSNASLGDSNPGINFHLLHLGYHF